MTTTRSSLHWKKGAGWTAIDSLGISSVRIAMVAFTLLAAACATAQVRYSVIRIAPSGFSLGWALNNRGQVTGTDHAGHAFLYSNGTLTDLGTLSGGVDSYGYGINNHGEVVGLSEVGGFSTQAFLYRDGSMMNLNPFWEVAGVAINDRGDVICSVGTHTFLIRDGTARDLGQIFATRINNRGEMACNPSRNAAIYSRGKLIDLGSLAGHGSVAGAINDRGEVVGVSMTRVGYVGAFLFSGGKMIGLGTTSDTLPCSGAFGINNAGSVVGQVYSPGLEGIYHAFLYENGQMVDLNTVIPQGTGMTLEVATGINDSGEILANSNAGAVLLEPIGALVSGAAEAMADKDE